MSELTQCNYCSLKAIERRAKDRGLIVTKRNGNGGIYIHVHKKSEPLDTTDWDDGNKQIVAWFMALGTSCEC